MVSSNIKFKKKCKLTKKVAEYMGFKMRYHDKKGEDI